MAVSGAIALAGLGYSVYKGLHAESQEKKAQKEEESLKRPFYKVQSEYYQNRNIAEEQASGGLPQGTKDYADIERKRGLNSSLQALQASGADPASFSQLLSGYDASLGKESAADAEQHIANIQYFMGANKDVAGQTNIGFGLNELQPYEDRLKQITQRRAAEKQNANNAISEGLGSLTSAAGNYNKLFGNKDPFEDNDIPDLSSPGETQDIDTGTIASPASNFDTITSSASAGATISQ